MILKLTFKVFFQSFFALSLITVRCFTALGQGELVDDVISDDDETDIIFERLSAELEAGAADSSAVDTKHEEERTKETSAESDLLAALQFEDLTNREIGSEDDDGQGQMMEGDIDLEAELERQLALL